MSQKFRNLRRKSHPASIKKPTTCTSRKLVTIHLAKPAERMDSLPLEGSDDDVIAYKRNCERLVSEFSRKSASDSLMVQLITETFPLRRKDIENSLQRTSELLKLYPFFLSEKWVSLDRYFNCQLIYIMHYRFC